MKAALRLFAIAVVFGIASAAWLILGALTSGRSSSQSHELRSKVVDLWGQPQAQAGPAITFVWLTDKTITKTETPAGGQPREVQERVREEHRKDVSFASTHVDAALHLDQRRKGLAWYSLYDVDLHGAWSYEHEEAEAGTLHVRFAFPDPQGVYDGFRFTIDGQPKELRPANGAIETDVPVSPGQVVALTVAYKSRGLDEWRYVPDPGVAALRDFHLTLATDFTDVDFPPNTLSPSQKKETASGVELHWDFERVVTGHAVGMTMPKRLQPGELAAHLSFSAPISLLFFFLILLVLGRLRGLDIHPVNYLFLAAAFFAFHLLFAYTADRLPLEAAFALSSAVSVLLVVSYLRLVVSPRFALVEAGLSQLVYLVGFSLAHFWEGYTGLTVTVLSIATLFLLMQLTGRIRWSGLGASRASSGPATPAIAQT